MAPHGLGRGLLCCAILTLAHVAAGAAVTGAEEAAAQMRERHHTQRARLRQVVFCHAIFPEDLKNVDAIGVNISSLDSPTMYVYSNGDPVSTALKAGATWEAHEMEQVLWAMRQQVPQQVDGAKVVMGAGSDLFVDVGSHIGWYSLNLAAAGFRVAAFEAMLLNRRLMRNTLCANQFLMDRFTLYPLALGERNTTCFIMSADNAKAYGILNCEVADPEAAEKAAPAGYAVREDYAPIDRMDKVLPLQDVKVMKLDVGGFEFRVLRGAEQLFKQHRVWHMMLEFEYNAVKHTLKGKPPKTFLRYIIRLGFRISPKSFEGPFIDEASEAQLEMLAELSKAPLNLFCVNTLIFQHSPGFKARVKTFATATEVLNSKKGP